MAVMDGDDADDDGLNWPHVASKSLVPASGGDGPCPKGGDHDLFTIQGQRACGKCRTVFPADDYDDDQPSELEGSNDPIIADTSVDFDFAGMRDTCRWWLDNCPRECLVMLAAEFELWTNKAKELL